MSDQLDADLLDQFVRKDSEAAFAELAQRHTNLVHSSALRQTGNAAAAEEITQAVFILLARRAASLRRGTVLPGWLYQTTRLTAANWQRAEFRRARREQEAFMQSTIQQSASENAWGELFPTLDQAMSRLGTTDRDALVLRYFQNRTLAEVGLAMGMEERAAQKRVARALEKLRRIFARNGVVLTVSLIAGAISANSVQAAPAKLAFAAGAAGTKGAVITTSLAALTQKTIETIVWLKIKIGLAVGTATAIVGATMTAIVLNAHASQTAAGVSLLTTNSPFILHIENPPWVTDLRFKRSEFLQAGPTPSEITATKWANVEYVGALQPNGFYFEEITVLPPPFGPDSPGERGVAGENADSFWAVYWAGDLPNQKREMRLSSKLPGMGGSPEDWIQRVSTIQKSEIKRANLFGLPPLMPDSFQLGDDNKFAAMSEKGELVRGSFNRVTNGKPYGLVYDVENTESHILRSFEIKYRYLSPGAPLPNYYEFSEVTRKIPKEYSSNTNWIEEVNYGIDPNITNGYHPAAFFTNLDMITSTMVMSNNIRYYAAKDGTLKKIRETTQAEADADQHKYSPQIFPQRHWSRIFWLTSGAAFLALTIWLIIRRVAQK